MTGTTPGVDVEVLDATISDPSVAAPTLEKPATTAYDPDKDREGARKGITYWLLTLLSLLFVISFLALATLKDSLTFDQLKSLVELLLGPLVALVSAATGFYFGAQSVRSAKLKSE
jgi:hypothetical protein